MHGTPFEKAFERQVNNFAQWLERTGLQQTTIDHYTHSLTQFMQWLEEQPVTAIEAITATHLENYQTHLEKRKNATYGGALNQNTINNHLYVLHRFSTYRQKYGYEPLPVHALKMKEPLETSRQVLTLHEVQRMYEATDNTPYGYRDRAVLSIYYGCGLRRAEGVALTLDDIDLKKRYVHVRKGKGNKERYVPMSKTTAEHFANYIYNSRSVFIKYPLQALMISYCGKPLEYTGMTYCVKRLLKTAGINKTISLHNLRHSIATHLLQSGMSLEHIAQFLGHSTLESTQIYTHLAYD